MLGIVTPFCSCSAVPLFIGFVESGIPLGVTFSFLIAAPTINEVAVIMLYGLFGWRVAALYIGSGLVIATIAGMVIGRLHLERYVEEFVWQLQMGASGPQEELTWPERISRAWDSVKEIVGKVWLYVVIGIAVGAGIHGFVPESALAGIMGKQAWWSVPAAVLLGIPLYSNAAGVIPIVSALMEKGASLGTVLAFMMSVVGLSLPETIILRLGAQNRNSSRSSLVWWRWRSSSPAICSTWSCESASDNKERRFMDDRDILTDALKFHGHRCYASVAGVRCGLAALRTLGVKRSGGTQLYAILETGEEHGGMCYGDGVQYTTGCTFGKGKHPQGAAGQAGFHPDREGQQTAPCGSRTSPRCKSRLPRLPSCRSARPVTSPTRSPKRSRWRWWSLSGMHRRRTS